MNGAPEPTGGRGGPRTPLADRDSADVQGHWLLARLGKRVLRPGGAELTETLLSRADVADAAVIELALVWDVPPARSSTGTRIPTSASTATRRLPPR
ncbi:MAG: hypothetical protein ACRDSP_04320 [Pseudonocardiaceae bacterium]